MHPSYHVLNLAILGPVVQVEQIKRKADQIQYGGSCRRQKIGVQHFQGPLVLKFLEWRRNQVKRSGYTIEPLYLLLS